MLIVTIVKQFLSRPLKILTGHDLIITSQVSCRKSYLGNEHAGWTINPDTINQNSIVYSFGIGEDISWDLAMIEKFGTAVFAFDPTPKCHEWLSRQNVPNQFIFQTIGLASYNGTARFQKPAESNHVSACIDPNASSNYFDAEVKTLRAIMDANNHSHIDILKMDIESAEYDVIENILNDNISIGQILIEFHHRFRNIGASKTRNAIRQLNSAGYNVFDVSLSGEEISFIKRKK